MSFRRVAACAALISAAAPALALAQVIEPNGIQVPLAPPGSSEESVQSYFASLMPPEPIDALADASSEPSTFSPLCGFEAELVLSQSSAAAGLAWYNLPSDPHAVPDAIYPIVMETTMTGAVATSDAIRSDASYGGGLIGFALTKGGKAIYYSESDRNAECTQCSMPGRWKMMLAYASELEPTTYYLAWEDWEGANETGWPDDGDFNDKVFRLTGVRCAGGGDACDTGKPGQCAAGVSACTISGESGCKQLVPAQNEVCDAIDNDCNGVVDDGTLCPPTEICKRGTCVAACGTGEFVCPAGQSCDEGDCVEPACVGVRCETGKVCRAGACLAPCEGVSCPLGQSCIAGACVDPCANANCDSGRVCREGACVDRCDCAGCPSGLRCETSSGQCVDPGCDGTRCAAGEVCVMGACQDACASAACPRGGACSAGHCLEPGAIPGVGSTTPGRMGTSAAGSGVLLADAGVTRAPGGKSRMRGGCSCRAVRGTALSRHDCLALALACVFAVRLRSRSRSRSATRL